MAPDRAAGRLPENGSTWCQAFRALSTALAVANPGTTVRVADGTYTPDTTGLADPRQATFELSNGVRIEGGPAARAAFASVSRLADFILAAHATAE